MVQTVNQTAPEKYQAILYFSMPGSKNANHTVPSGTQLLSQTTRHFSHDVHLIIQPLSTLSASITTWLSILFLEYYGGNGC
jgi:hypothetical protein